MTEAVEFPEDMNQWTALHWLVTFIQTSGPVTQAKAIRIAAVLLQHPEFIMSALEEAGAIEALPAVDEAA